MICPYNNFGKCDWENCAARMYIKDPSNSYYLMRVCAIAYNGGTVPAKQLCHIGPQQMEGENGKRY